MPTLKEAIIRLEPKIDPLHDLLGFGRFAEVTLDKQGRTCAQSLVNDLGGQTYAASTYVSSGRLATGSNPFRGTAPTCSTAYAGNSFGYGGVNHVKSITQADSSAAPRRPRCLADPALREKHLPRMASQMMNLVAADDGGHGPKPTL